MIMRLTSAINLLLAFALGYLTGCGDKVLVLEPCKCDDKALDLSACDDLFAKATLNREHGQLARAQALEDEARALGCADAPLPKTD